ncbi:hypothetical protein SAMN05443245_7669 [Paraburkholderia fungorum]|uniref:Uncharacterized protein n=1 Tax=Paraburkholderia fungorum TaxID=134537 RepID=A0A1H1K004_9BURK|nr:hypothetical protein [Paraburkholderia fungorum]SDR55370.1 hypothetical protein SAMN05443245_7669 [Paraburkholderia fungorum]
MDSLSLELLQACEDYRRYIDAIFQPAMNRLETDISRRQVRLHEVFGANLFVAHAIDYVQAIRRFDEVAEIANISCVNGERSDVSIEHQSAIGKARLAIR